MFVSRLVVDGIHLAQINGIVCWTMVAFSRHKVKEIKRAVASSTDIQRDPTHIITQVHQHTGHAATAQAIRRQAFASTRTSEAGGAESETMSTDSSMTSRFSSESTDMFSLEAVTLALWLAKSVISSWFEMERD